MQQQLERYSRGRCLNTYRRICQGSSDPSTSALIAAKARERDDHSTVAFFSRKGTQKETESCIKLLSVLVGYRNTRTHAGTGLVKKGAARGFREVKGGELMPQCGTRHRRSPPKCTRWCGNDEGLRRLYVSRMSTDVAQYYATLRALSSKNSLLFRPIILGGFSIHNCPPIR